MPTSCNAFATDTITVPLSATSYILHCIIASITLYSLFSTSNGVKTLSADSKALVAFIAIVFVFGTLNFGTYFKAVTLCKPILSLGKPSQAIDNVLIYGDVSNVSALVMKLMTELFLLYRCYLIWGNAWYILVCTGSLFLTVITFGCMNIVYLATPPSHVKVFHFKVDTVYWCLSLALNITLTILIISRVFWMRRVLNIMLQFGSKADSHPEAEPHTENSLMSGRILDMFEKERCKLYYNVMTMLVESCVVYCLVAGLAYALSRKGLGGPGDGKGAAYNMFTPFLCQSEAMAVELIVFRVSMGRASRNDNTISTFSLKLIEEQLTQFDDCPPTSPTTNSPMKAAHFSNRISTVSLPVPAFHPRREKPGK